MSFWWQERSGAFSPMRAAALALASGPALWIGYLALTNGLGSRPITAALHMAGDWSVRFLLASLAVSPLRRLMNWQKLHPARQIFGLASFAYAALHIALYVLDQKFALGRVLSEIVQRIYLGIGSIAFVGLLILTINSGEGAVRRLGRDWNALHKWVYAIVPFVLLHFFIQSKLNVAEPLVMTGFALWLLGYRTLSGDARTSPLALVILALAAAIGTQVIELVWYATATRVNASSIAEGIFDFESEIRPMWHVLSVTLPLALAPVLAGTQGGRQARAGSRAAR